MSDFAVDMEQLAGYAKRLEDVGSDIASHLAAQQLGAVATGMAGGLAAAASSGQFASAWADAVRATTKHLDSHAATLNEVSRAYLAEETDAATSVRGFFEGRL